MNYAFILLPLPLFTSFTYSIPPEFEEQVTVGSRVIVQFGRKKFYTGLVAGLTPTPPGNFEIKPIMAVLDDGPIVRYPQLKLWEWISEYYLCSQGDVFKAAVPTGLKPESETWITLSPDYDPADTVECKSSSTCIKSSADTVECKSSSTCIKSSADSLAPSHPRTLAFEKEALVIMLLTQEKKMKLADLEEKLKLGKGSTLISRMLSRGILEIAETLSSRYRPKTISCVRLTVPRDDADALHSVMDAVSRAPQQEKALLAYLSLTPSFCGPRAGTVECKSSSTCIKSSAGTVECKSSSTCIKSSRLDAEEDFTPPIMNSELCIINSKSSSPPIPKSTLLAHSGVSPAVLAAMRDKGIFEFVKITVNRFNPTLSCGPRGGTVGRPSAVAVECKSSSTCIKSSRLDAEEDFTQPIMNSELCIINSKSSSLAPSLSPLQRSALDAIRDSWREKNVVLLRGVTGSGKTEIYSHLINTTLSQGDQVLYLVPEISLTTQLTDRLRAVFGDRLLVYHSRFSDNERVDLWKTLLYSNEPYVIIGARSAVFLPFARLGLIVVDEEHDPSYKQYDPAPRYNARDTAIVLAGMHGCKTLLGSATPSIESYYKALTGKYGLVELESRFDDSPLPDVEIVDMKRQRKEKLARGILSAPLVEAATEALVDGRQAILFQNRRGFAPVVVCRSCGWSPKCQNCDVSLVYHKHSDSLHCHYCGFSMRQPSVCPACGENDIEVFGYGTQRIEEEITEAFPDARISRMDLDTTRNKDAYHDLITEFSNQETDILVGTQMVTKGLDFGKVKVVGVLNADTVLNHPDFRSNEKGFNMLEQVAGRAGRRKEKGRVVIQTTNPSNPILDYVRRHDYRAYYEAEISARRELNYPPFSKLIMVYVKNKDPQIVEAAAQLLVMALRDVFGERVLGPDTPFVSRVATYYLRQIMLKIEVSASLPKVKAILRAIYESLARDTRIRSSILYYDVDPL